MDELMEIMKYRRNIRRYKPDAVPDELIEKILEAARWSPSGDNAQPWSFIVLRDPEKKGKAFRFLISGEVSAFLAEAPVVIVVCAKLDVWDVPYDSAMATQNMMLMAHALGLGSCCVVAPVSDMRDDIKTMKLLNVPHGYKIVAPVAIGYPAESRNPRPRLELDEIVFYEELGKRRKQ